MLKWIARHLAVAIVDEMERRKRQQMRAEVDEWIARMRAATDKAAAPPEH